MLKWAIQKGVISSLQMNDEELINPWGIETADSWSFFSQEKGIGYRYDNLNYEESISDSSFKTSSHVKMNEGEWKLETNDEISGNKIIRKARLVCLQDSYFMDFVVRFRFKKSLFKTAEIAGKKIEHTGTNIYHQYSVEEAFLRGETLQVKIKINQAECQSKFVPHLYVRDHEDEWVVHARMIPVVEDKNIIKLCSRYFKTSPLPQAISNILLSSKTIKKNLWYRGEHSPYKNKIAKIFSPNAFPLVYLKKGEELYWSVEMEVNGR